MKNYETARAEFEKAKAEAEALAKSLQYIVDEENARREKFATKNKGERIMKDFEKAIEKIMCEIENIEMTDEVIAYLKAKGCYEETYKPVFNVLDYLEKMYEC